MDAVNYSHVMKKIPEIAIMRLSKMYQFLLRLSESKESHISSSEIGDYIGTSANTVRKDVSYLGGTQTTGARYEVTRLAALIAEKLAFTARRKACVVGLGKIGSAILFYDRFEKQGFDLVAGFDSNINKVETLKTKIPLYPSHMIEEIVKRDAIELAVLCVPVDSAQGCAERLMRGGIKGIVNYTSAILKTNLIHVSNVDITGEFRALSALFEIDRQGTQGGNDGKSL